MSTGIPSSSWYSLNRLIQALRSEVQLLQCTIATRLPSGVVTMSIISYGLDNSFSKTIMENEEVPADTFPVRCLTALVATMPVPASPSGGQTGIPAFKWPDTSSLLAPSGVRNPAFSPAGKTLGRISVSFQGYPLGATNLSNLAIISAE